MHERLIIGITSENDISLVYQICQLNLYEVIFILTAFFVAFTRDMSSVAVHSLSASSYDVPVRL